MNNPNLVFLKLGGAAITDKSKPRTPLLDNITRLAHQIARAVQSKPELRLLIGHGSGSFGHYSGQKHGTRNGVTGREGWLGFAEVWKDARALNELVLQALLNAGLPVVAFPPSTWMTTVNHDPQSYYISPILCAINEDLIPVVNGDVIFDSTIGGTILSTEEVFFPLVEELRPARIILASREPGVWEDYPENTRLASRITPQTLIDSANNVHGSAGMDVTGGMAKKVTLMMSLLKKHPDLQISIIGGMDNHSVFDALIDKPSGTLLHLD